MGVQEAAGIGGGARLHILYAAGRCICPLRALRFQKGWVRAWT